MQCSVNSLVKTKPPPPGQQLGQYQAPPPGQQLGQYQAPPPGQQLGQYQATPLVNTTEPLHRINCHPNHTKLHLNMRRDEAASYNKVEQTENIYLLGERHLFIAMDCALYPYPYGSTIQPFPYYISSAIGISWHNQIPTCTARDLEMLRVASIFAFAALLMFGMANGAPKKALDLESDNDTRTPFDDDENANEGGNDGFDNDDDDDDAKAEVVQSDQPQGVNIDPKTDPTDLNNNGVTGGRSTDRKGLDAFVPTESTSGIVQPRCANADHAIDEDFIIGHSSAV
eukprot:Em0018g585a